MIRERRMGRPLRLPAAWHPARTRLDYHWASEDVRPRHGCHGLTHRSRVERVVLVNPKVQRILKRTPESPPTPTIRNSLTGPHCPPAARITSLHTASTRLLQRHHCRRHVPSRRPGRCTHRSQLQRLRRLYRNAIREPARLLYCNLYSSCGKV